MTIKNSLCCALGLLAFLFAMPANAQPLPPLPQGVADAEEEQDWDLVIELCEKAIAKNPERDDLWIRIANIEETRGDTAKAKAAVDKALKIKPDNIEYLRRHAKLAIWAQDSASAEKSYRAILKQEPKDYKSMLGLGQVLSWQGKTKKSIGVMEPYVAANPKEKEGLLLLSQLYRWNGDAEKAAGMLERYRKVAGKTEEYKKERTQLLVVNKQVEGAVAGANSVPQHRDFVQARYEYSTDSDTIDISTMAIDGRYRLKPDYSLVLGAKTGRLRADIGSGLETQSGNSSIHQSAAWVGVEKTVDEKLLINGRVGLHGAGSSLRPLLHGGAEYRFNDTLTAAYDFNSDLYAVSPLALSKNIRLADNQLHGTWNIRHGSSVYAKANYGFFSDNNKYWSVMLEPRQTVIETKKFNADIGVSVQAMGFSKDMTNGYYDPKNYTQLQAIVGASYWFNSDSMVGITGGIGKNKDHAMSSYKRSASYAADGNFGLYKDWTLNLHAAHSDSIGINSNKYNAESYTAALKSQF